MRHSGSSLIHLAMIVLETMHIVGCVERSLGSHLAGHRNNGLVNGLKLLVCSYAKERNGGRGSQQARL